MEQQLRFQVPHEDEWRIDEKARQAGLKGVIAARAALNSVKPPAPVIERSSQPSPPTGPPVQLELPVGWRTQSGEPF